jgi:hypothetical protein
MPSEKIHCVVVIVRGCDIAEVNGEALRYGSGCRETFVARSLRFFFLPELLAVDREVLA